MAQEARVIHLQKELIELGYNNTLRALNWMIEVMNANNGYKRHDGSHYYYHLVDGCQDLINHGIVVEDILTAFVLHDSEEDCDDITNDMIAERFGGTVALYVKGVTKKPDVNYKEADNLQKYLDDILPFVEMCLIKTADRKHNFSTLEHAPPEKELRQALETETHFLPFFKEARNRYPQFSRYFHSAKTTIVPHLKKIKKYHYDMDKMRNYLNIQEKRINELEYKLNLLGGNINE